jgi:ATPase family protein associated with various cellular activities (AAA)
MSDSDITPDDIFGDDGQPSPRVMMAVMQHVVGQQGGTQIIADDSVKMGDSFTIPDGMTYEQAIRILRRKRDDDETNMEFTEEFLYRPMDGAYATMQVLKERFGITLGKSIQSLFGTRPPELRRIQIAPGVIEQVPWGLLEIPTLEGVEMMMCDGHQNREYGRIFCLHVTAPRKYRAQIEQLFEEIEQHLKTSSIYRGQAIIGHDEPEFLDLSGFNPEQVVHSTEVKEQLEASLWSVLRYTEAMRRDGIPRKRAVLLHGPYGTGKTLTGQLTAQIATENGWTFIAARPGRDDLEDVMRTARLYQPAVVFFEDVDTETSTSDDAEVAELLDTFDGIVAKGGELLMLMTTNQIDRIHEGMFRPGRLDALVPIEALDRPGVEQLVKVYVKGDRLDEVDYDEVYGAMEGFLPAFIREAVTRASSVALARVDGRAQYKITTSDLVTAASSLRPQLEQMQKAQKGEKPPTLESALGGTVRDALHGGKIMHGEDSPLVLSLNGNGHE